MISAETNSVFFLFKKAFSRKLCGHVAARLGEGQNGIALALDGIVAVMMEALLRQANSGQSLALYGAVLQAYYSVNGECETVTALLGVLGSASEPGGQLVDSLFISSRDTLAGAVGEYAGIRPESATVLLDFMGAALPALLGQYAVRNRLDANAMAGWLLGLKVQVRALLNPRLGELYALLRASRPEQEPAAVVAGSFQAALWQALRVGAGLGMRAYATLALALVTLSILGLFGLKWLVPSRMQVVSGVHSANRLIMVPKHGPDTTTFSVPLAAAEPHEIGWMKDGN